MKKYSTCRLKLKTNGRISILGVVDPWIYANIYFLPTLSFREIRMSFLVQLKPLELIRSLYAPVFSLSYHPSSMI